MAHSNQRHRHTDIQDQQSEVSLQKNLLLWLQECPSDLMSVVMGPLDFLIQIKGSQLLWSLFNSNNSSSMRPFLNPPEQRAKSHHSLLGPQGPVYHRDTWARLWCPALTYRQDVSLHLDKADERLLSPAADAVPSTQHMLRRCPLMNEGGPDGTMSQTPVYSPHAPLSGLWTVHISGKSVPRTRHKNPKVTPCETKSNPDAIRS